MAATQSIPDNLLDAARIIATVVHNIKSQTQPVQMLTNTVSLGTISGSRHTTRLTAAYPSLSHLGLELASDPH